MSVSQHPVALHLERQVGGATRLLATVMGLPLIDGILPALIIAGALRSPVDIIETGLLVFGGSATMAVILAEMEGTPREQATAVLMLGAVLLPIAAIEAALAETLASVLTFEIFHRFAGLVILTIAAKTASAKVGEYLPSPGLIIVLGLVASFDPSGAQFVTTPDMAAVRNAVAAVGVGLAFALSVALAAPRLRGAVDIDMFRFGSAVALGMLALSVLQVPGVPKDAPIALGVLGVTAVFAYDPGSADAERVPDAENIDDVEAGAVDDAGDADGANGADAVAVDETDGVVAADSGGVDAGVGDASDTGLGYLGDGSSDDGPFGGSDGDGDAADEESRAPWL